MRAIKNKMQHARLGLVVTKKGNAKAVRRNRIKRIVRETFRHHQANLGRYDIVVQVMGPMDDAKLKYRVEELLESLAKDPSEESEASEEIRTNRAK